jgi:hypothetical protein
MFVFDILQIPSGYIQICNWCIALTCYHLGYGPVENEKTLKMPSQVVDIPAELRSGHLPNWSQNDAARISYNIIKNILF